MPKESDLGGGFKLRMVICYGSVLLIPNFHCFSPENGHFIQYYILKFHLYWHSDPCEQISSQFN